ncbi:P-loop NTPase fold protein [Sneathiella sp. HT1-7]|uniref:KAP family P-loop NTPase fold protein n=1 Tax=Sneathiella sp. HT1-7 TaxID=2887192 RepID=UPI001D151070|nr:P-loop NTPase fold protein [Sneathiella sp. HT1-7]MCC3305390.1 KAP family NTPase [Sneathiella sp. HT1-7]
MTEELIIRKEKLKEIWIGDHLERWKDADFLFRFLTERMKERTNEKRSGSYVINLDAKWGGGKTFFLERFAEQLRLDNHLVVYINAWEDDHAEDPLIPIIAEINNTLCPYFKGKRKLQNLLNVTKKSGLQILTTGLKHAAITGSKKVVGGGLSEITELISDSVEQDSTEQVVDEASIEKAVSETVEKLTNKHAEDLLRSFLKTKEVTTKFRKSLTKLLIGIEENKTVNIPLFVLVDELDRCRPTYAIELLERVKHLFNVDNVVFILATDTDQLQHSIKAVYGSEFDAKRYLNRFFDRPYVFESPEISQFVEHLYKLHLSDVNNLSSPFEEFTDDDQLDLKFLQCTFNAFLLELRDIEQCFELLRNVITVWRNSAKIELIVMVPLIILYQQKRTFNQLASQSLPSHLKELRSENAWSFIYKLPSPKQELFNNKSFKSNKNIEFSGLLNLVWNNGNKNFFDTKAEFYGPSNFPSIEDQWSIKILNDEFNLEHYSHNYSGLSKIAQYPRLISSAGQLVDLSRDED